MEANRLLRFIAVSNSSVAEVNDRALQLDVNLLGKTLRLEARRYPSSDLGILYQVLGKSEYAVVIDLVNQLNLKAPLSIVDAGANVGYASLYFKAAFPDARILALEIDASNANQLERNIASNSLSDLRASRQALWSHNANLRIRRDFRDQSECSFYVEETEERPDVTGSSLEQLCHELSWTGVDILKIDVEGGERHLFATDLLADKLLAATHILAIEIHDKFGIRPMMLRHFERNGFRHVNRGDLTIAYRATGLPQPPLNLA